MAGKILGRAKPLALTDTTLYTVPVGLTSTLYVNLCNRSGNEVSVRIALSNSATPALEDYIEYDATIAGNGVLERGGIVMEAGKFLVIYTSAATVSAVAWGFEE